MHDILTTANAGQPQDMPTGRLQFQRNMGVTQGAATQPLGHTLQRKDTNPELLLRTAMFGKQMSVEHTEGGGNAMQRTFSRRGSLPLSEPSKREKPVFRRANSSMASLSRQSSLGDSVSASGNGAPSPTPFRTSVGEKIGLGGDASRITEGGYSQPSGGQGGWNNASSEFSSYQYQDRYYGGQGGAGGGNGGGYYSGGGYGVGDGWTYGDGSSYGANGGSGGYGGGYSYYTGSSDHHEGHGGQRGGSGGGGGGGPYDAGSSPSYSQGPGGDGYGGHQSSQYGYDGSSYYSAGDSTYPSEQTCDGQYATYNYYGGGDYASTDFYVGEELWRVEYTEEGYPYYLQVRWRALTADTTGHGQ